MSAHTVGRTAVVVRHVAFEDLGTFRDVLAARGFAITLVDAGVDEVAPALATADLAVVLGGPIGVYEGDRYPFLAAELGALAARLQRGRPTLGICLGAQLIAAALGAPVYPGGRKEIGWSAIGLTAAGRRSCLAELAAQPVLHWHGDTFDLPAGAEHLASTGVYPHQAFALGCNVLALQFHVEVDARRIEQWLIGHTCELTSAGIDLGALRAGAQREGEGVRAAGATMLSRWLDQLEW